MASGAGFLALQRLEIEAESEMPKGPPNLKNNSRCEKQ